MERIFVTVRARPISIEESKTSPWKISANSIFLSNNPSTKFDFDRIFDGDCKTADVYEARTKEIVASAVGGFNGTVFAYGQTSSGKTHTMSGSVAEPGVIPCAVHDLFTSIQEDVGREFLVRMSYMEIYNEEINDLLAPEHRKLQIHESLEKGIYIAGLREEIVTCPEQVLNFMEFGESHRHIGQTNMNLYSSRSHTIFRMIIESRERLEDGDVNSCDAVRVSVLNLVDLAGSERAAKTGAEGVRLKEGSHINKSLMTLGTVIKKLSEGAESQGGHVPYRDSKLTRILQPSLGGNANTAIICNITLAQMHTDETKSSLQFASRALRVKNCACVNEILTDAALLKRQRKEIEELRAKLLSSHSEHLEEEILNLRNTLLQIELEKERIALELEEEKKDKALRERRLAEQAKKIANLSSMVLCSERNEISTNPSKNKRRVTWCPGPFLQKSDSKISTPNEEAIIRGLNEDGQDVNMPPTFEELTQESATFMDDLRSGSCTLDQDDKWDEFILPDARALLHVTSRRKIHQGRAGSIQEVINESLEKESTYEDRIFNDDVQMKTKEAGYDSLTYKSMESECDHRENNTHSFFHQLYGSASCDPKRSTLFESETIHVIKQLDDETSLVQMENTAMMKNLDSVLVLDCERNPNLVQNFDEESMVFPSIEVSKELHEVALQIDHSKIVVDNVLSFVRDLFQSFSIISERLQGVKSFATEDLVQFQSIICVHRKIQSYMRNKMDELELEKSKLQNQLIDHQKQIQELKSDIVNWESAMADKCSQHELEKNELLGQILFLQKEVSFLPSSALVREKESMRKELDKTKLKLKDTESKLKNTIQDKTKLESDKMQAEREVKRLIGQRAILERDIWKRDSLIDRRHSKLFDSSNPKGPVDIHEQTLQADYQKLDAHAFEMEAEVASLKEALTNNLNAADLEINFLKEEIVKMEQKLGDSESHSRDLKASLDLLTREKEEREMQIADAFLEMEVEKTTWLSKEKTLMDSHERLKLSDHEITRLSNGLLEVRRELESLKEQCRILRESFLLAEEKAERGNDCSSTISSENVLLGDKGKQCEFDSNECGDAWSKLEAECHHAWAEVKKLQEQLNFVTEEWDKLSLQLKKDKNEYKNFAHKLLAMTVERDVLLSKTVELKKFLVDAKIQEDEYTVLSKGARIDAVEMKIKAHNASELEIEAYPLLDELTSKISTLNLERVRRLKSRLVALTRRVQKVRDEIEQLMDDDGDMAEMYLTEKKRRMESFFGDQSLQGYNSAGAGVSVSAPVSPVSSPPESRRLEKTLSIARSRHSMKSSDSAQENIEELEMLLEAYFVVFDSTLNKLTSLKEYIDDTEDFINIQLDNVRNQLIQFELILTTATFVVTIFSVVAGIFGMNFEVPFFDNLSAFEWVIIITGVSGLIIFCCFLFYFKYRRLMPL